MWGATGNQLNDEGGPTRNSMMKYRIKVKYLTKSLLVKLGFPGDAKCSGGSWTLFYLFAGERSGL